MNSDYSRDTGSTSINTRVPPSFFPSRCSRSAVNIRWSVDLRYQDGRRPVKSAREPGFLARSRQRPEEVVTTLAGYLRIREAAAAYARTPGIRL